MPIGQPIANTVAFVVDGNQGLVPAGVPGELCLGGDGLARGYFGRPDRTAERFVPDSASSRPGLRLYRTGDLVRRRADGAIEFLGRFDHQVKIRGFRIELGEIETALLRHPAVRHAVILAREDAPGDRRLVAYCVLRDGTDLDAAGLRAFLAQGLPDYMIPAAWVFLESLPLTSHGKVDRRSLPEPGEEVGARSAPPETPLQGALAEIWCEVLGYSSVGIHDDFFELGGHSLLATQVITRIRGELGVDVPVRQLYDAPTLQQLALCVEELLFVQAGTDRLELELQQLEAMSDEEIASLLADDFVDGPSQEPQGR